MSVLKEFLHNRIEEKGLKLFEDNYYTESAREALLQVEVALKEKFPFENNNLSAVQFINKYFIEDDKAIRDSRIKLLCKYGDQQKLKLFFNGVFSHYRNNLSHQDIKLNKVEAFRILIIASELLDLLDTSSVSYLGNNKLEGLIKMNIFKDKLEFISFLEFIEGQYIVDDICDGFFEDLYMNDFNDDQYHAVMEYGLVSFDISKIDHSDEPPGFENDNDEIGFFNLTELGKKELAESKK
jgi:hypothetical protein